MVNPISRPCRETGTAKEDPISKAFDPKLRKTNRAVGYVGVSWPDNKLYGRQFFELMRDLRELRKQQEFEMKRSVRDLKYDLHQHGLEEQRLGRRIQRKNEAIRRALEQSRLKYRAAEDEIPTRGRTSGSTGHLYMSRGKSPFSSTRLGRRSSSLGSNSRLAKEPTLVRPKSSSEQSRGLMRSTLSPVWERPVKTVGSRKNESRPSLLATTSLSRASSANTAKLRKVKPHGAAQIRHTSSHVQPGVSSLVPALDSVKSRKQDGVSSRHSAIGGRDLRGLPIKGTKTINVMKTLKNRSSVIAGALKRTSRNRDSPRKGSRVSKKRIPRSSSSIYMENPLPSSEVGLRKKKRVVKVANKIAKQSSLQSSKIKRNSHDIEGTKMYAKGRAPDKEEGKDLSGSEGMAISRARRQPKGSVGRLKTRMSKHHSSDDSHTGSTSKLVKDLDKMIQIEKAKTWRKLQELSGIHVDEEQDSNATNEKMISPGRASISSIKETSVALPEGSPDHPAGLRIGSNILVEDQYDGSVALSPSQERSEDNIMVPLYSVESEDLINLKKYSDEHIDRNYFSDSSSSISSFHFNGQGQIDIDVIQSYVTLFVHDGCDLGG